MRRLRTELSVDKELAFSPGIAIIMTLKSRLTARLSANAGAVTPLLINCRHTLPEIRVAVAYQADRQSIALSGDFSDRLPD